MAKIELKQPIVEEIKAHIDGAQTEVIVNYSCVTVEQDTKLRKAMREEGIVYKVYKNTMMKRAFAGTEFESLNDSLEGPNAIAISTTDATAPARLIAKFAKDVPNLEMVAGVVEGQFYDARECRLFPRFQEEKNFSEDYLGLCRAQSQTLLVFLTRSQKLKKRKYY